MRSLRVFFGIGLLAVLAAASAPPVRASDSDYTTRVLSAAPPAVAAGAAVARMEKDGSLTSLRAGTNGFTCMSLGPNPMCLDANSLDFIHAVMTHKMPADKVGIGYMLQGDSGASNTDPYAEAKTANNYWVVTGPHIMLFGPAVKTMGIPATKDADPTKPYIMWAGTPYAHAMIPVGSSK